MCAVTIEEYEMPNRHIYSHIIGDALDWAENEGYCMIHVCNNKGAFGGGPTALATQVKERFPEVYESYMDNFRREGSICGDSASVVNLIAQDGYGARWKGMKYFREDWFESSIKALADDRRIIEEYLGEDSSPNTIVVPYRMGADRAGGDWEWIIEKVREILGPYFNILVVQRES